LVLPELTEELLYIFLEYVPSNQFLHYMFKMIINWPVAFILSNFVWKPGGKNLFSIIIYYFLSIVFIYADSSRAAS